MLTLIDLKVEFDSPFYKNLILTMKLEFVLTLYAIAYGVSKRI